MTHEELKALLLRDASWEAFWRAIWDGATSPEVQAAYAEEAARTILQAQAGERSAAAEAPAFGKLDSYIRACEGQAESYRATGDEFRTFRRLFDEGASHLRERDAAVRALLEAISEIDDEGEPSYGYYLGGDPRDFSPDEECCSPEEISAHAEACRAWDRGECPDLGGPHQPLTAEDCVAYEMALGVAREHPPEFAGYKTVAHYGIGTTMLRDPRTVTLKALAAAVRKHFPEGT